MYGSGKIAGIGIEPFDTLPPSQARAGQFITWRLDNRKPVVAVHVFIFPDEENPVERGVAGVYPAVHGIKGCKHFRLKALVATSVGIIKGTIYSKELDPETTCHCIDGVVAFSSTNSCGADMGSFHSKRT